MSEQRSVEENGDMAGAVGGCDTKAEESGNAETQEVKADVKAEAPEGTKYIKVKVLGHDDTSSIHFKVKMTTPLGKLKKAYSMHKDIHVSYLRFLFDGKRISDTDTPEKLDMMDEDSIEVYKEQIGGYYE